MKVGIELEKATMKPQILQHFFLFGCPGGVPAGCRGKPSTICPQKCWTQKCWPLNAQYSTWCVQTTLIYDPMANSFPYMDGGRQLSSIFCFLPFWLSWESKGNPPELEVNSPLIRPAIWWQDGSKGGGPLLLGSAPVIHFTNFSILVNWATTKKPADTFHELLVVSWGSLCIYGV